MIRTTDRGTASADSGEIRFCSYCGTKYDNGARFCKGCGKAVTPKSRNQGCRNDEPITEQKTVYEGYIHKCPNCGEILDAFVTKCPLCGSEIRDARSASSVRDFTTKLEQIEAQKMPDIVEDKSLMKTLVGKDFKEKDEVVEAQNNFQKQKDREKANLIINFSVPNTKEDIMEFMILASSNIDTKHSINDVVTKAWISKLDQVYQKAVISIDSHKDFDQINSIYEKKHNQIKKRKLIGVLGWIGGIAVWFFSIGMVWNPVATICISVGVLLLPLIGFIFLKKR